MTRQSRGRILLALALGSLAAALGAQGGRWSAGLDLLAGTAPLWFLSSGLALIGALLTHPLWRGPIVVASLLGLGLAGALLAPEFLRPQPGQGVQPGAPGLRVIQLNLGGRGVADAGRAADWLASQHPDLIFLDDVDPEMRRALERRGFTWRRGTAWTAIASRQPLTSAPFRFSAADWRSMPDVARGRLPTPGGPIDLVAVHLKRPIPGLGDPAFGPSRLEDLASRYDNRRLIIAGDLNLTPWSFALRRLDGRLGLARRDRADFSWPARFHGHAWPAPFMPLDHLYAGSAWRTTRVAVGPPIGATHYPLVVDLEEAR
jgi:endonuclease/exonuclease/phosphatase (EEP) superfamily protein YafD